MALEDFRGDSYDRAWMMDDDINPEPDCLERLQDRAYVETGPSLCSLTRSNRMERSEIRTVGAASSSPRRLSKGSVVFPGRSCSGGPRIRSTAGGAAPTQAFLASWFQMHWCTKMRSGKVVASRPGRTTTRPEISSICASTQCADLAGFLAIRSTHGSRLPAGESGRLNRPLAIAAAIYDGIVGASGSDTPVNR